MVTWVPAGAQTGHSRFAGAAEVAVSGGGAQPPELVPALSRGRHRSPRQGACLMELASYLAGERWSAHPACTHPLLAALARDVNDHTPDAGLARLAVLAPSVIGLTGDEPHLDARITLVCARMALPVAAASRQQIMAASVLACERVLAGYPDLPTGPFASARHRSSSMPRWRQSRRRISRSRTRCSVTCSSARSASAPGKRAAAPRRDTTIAVSACTFTSTAAVRRRQARPPADHERSPAPGSVMRTLPPLCVDGSFLHDQYLAGPIWSFCVAGIDIGRDRSFIVGFARSLRWGCAPCGRAWSRRWTPSSGLDSPGAVQLRSR
jgi:hypothetical protein